MTTCDCTNTAESREVDYQPAMFKSVASGDKTIVKNDAIFAAKAANILGVPGRENVTSRSYSDYS